MRNSTKKIAALALAIATICLMAIPSFAINGINSFKDNDCWKIGRTASYVNPDTGLTADGGDNSPIGMAMSNNLVDKRMMLEHTPDGKYYITFSMVGMTFSKDLRVYRIDANGKQIAAKHAVTYTSNQSLGTQHMRIEVKPTDKYISVRLFVMAMGRDVQFYITPELGNAQKGCGPFVSEFYPGRYEQETQNDMSGFIDLIPTKPGGEKPGESGQQGAMTTVPRQPVKPVAPKPQKPIPAPTQTSQQEISTQSETTTLEQTETLLDEITDTELATDELEETTIEVKDEGMSTGAKAGIIIGVIAAVAIIGGVIYVIINKKKA